MRLLCFCRGVGDQVVELRGMGIGGIGWRDDHPVCCKSTNQISTEIERSMTKVFVLLRRDWICTSEKLGKYGSSVLSVA